MNGETRSGVHRRSEVPLGGRGGRGAMAPAAPRLLLDLPGEPPSAALPTPGAACSPGPRATGAPRTVLAMAKAPAMAGRTERALVAALAQRPAGRAGGPGRHPTTTWRRSAQLLLGLRQAGSDPMGASRALIAVLDADPTAVGAPPRPAARARARRSARSSPPGVPAVLPVGREALALLVSELLTATGRHLDAAALLDNLPPTHGGGRSPSPRCTWRAAATSWRST